MSLLDIADLSAGYGDLEVLHGVSLGVDEGDITVILGANGAGKTTLLRAISGLIPSRGALTFDGVDLRGRRLSAARRGIAQVPQGRGTFGALTVQENLRIGGYHRSAQEVEQSIKQWEDIFPRLNERSNQPAAGLSGGEQQMLAIARAMMSAPRLLLLDEPSLGLAPKITQGLFETLKQINQDTGVTILVVEQNAHLTLRIADNAVLMDTGRMGDKRPAVDLLNDESVQRAYLGA